MTAKPVLGSFSCIDDSASPADVVRIDLTLLFHKQFFSERWISSRCSIANQGFMDTETGWFLERAAKVTGSLQNGNLAIPLEPLELFNLLKLLEKAGFLAYKYREA